jgi:hypothetical protein
MANLLLTHKTRPATTSVAAAFAAVMAADRGRFGIDSALAMGCAP